ncbi:MarR family winged helix-turn-helix transcriptional regulator [Streptosporangium amethystogenes]|uniref:MarR family winged helix-turn-helix transcriptional regulator n=1 Tax=Streptosporangium amethystogenes TaxID=2002 RepID=UPI00378EA18B
MLPSPAAVQAQWAAEHPGLDTSPGEIIELLKRINGLLIQAIEPIYEGAPLAAHEADLLIPLRYARTPVIARHIAEHHGLSRAAVSKTLAKLECRGYISRTPSPNDRRVALITITPEGEKVIDAFFPRQLRVEAVLLAQLDEDRPRVLDALTLLANSLKAGLSSAVSTD